MKISFYKVYEMVLEKMLSFSGFYSIIDMYTYVKGASFRDIKTKFIYNIIFRIVCWFYGGWICHNGGSAADK